MGHLVILGRRRGKTGTRPVASGKEMEMLYGSSSWSRNGKGRSLLGSSNKLSKLLCKSESNVILLPPVGVGECV